MFESGRIEDFAAQVVHRISPVIESDVPKYLYKYTKRSYANELVRKGNIFLGSLYGYGDKELHSAGRHDDLEGIFKTSFLNGSNIPVTFPAVSLPTWIYCVSENKTPDLYDEFDPSYDTIVRIDSIPFMNNLWQATKSMCAIGTLRKIQYIPKNSTVQPRMPRDKYGNALAPHAVTMKRSVFSSQREWRMCLEPVNSIQFTESDSAHFENAFEHPIQGGILESLPRKLRKKVLSLKPFKQTIPTLSKHCKIVHRR